MSGTRLSDKFPGLTPVSSPPSLFTINGVGTGLYGSRDHDEETGTYIKTYCLCVIFIPVIALSAYRVAYAGDGSYYFIGKQPLSGFAKAWNGFLALLLLVGGGFWGFQAWYNSPEAVAGRELAAAERSAAAGRHAEAIASYEALAAGTTAKAGKANDKLQTWLAAPPQDATPQDKLAAWRAAVRLQSNGRWGQQRQQLCDAGLALAGDIGAAAPDVALSLLDESAAIDADPQASAAKRRKLLETLHTAQPKDVALTVRLATALETEGNLERAVELVTPLADRLGDTEGARILGQHLVTDGKYDEAYPLLLPYCETRLARFREAEATLIATYEAAQQAALARLRNGQGDPVFYERYEAASDEEKQQMVNEYLENAVKNDAQLAAQQEALIKEGRIVPVALDLGLVQLQRAQSLADPAARQAELQQAEKTFLAVGNAAGESDQFQLNLGKVYYWLGKQEEGRKLFDAILARNAGNFSIRIGLAHVLREVGAEAEARDLAEKVYGEESDEANKSSAASLRSILSRDADEEILWLSRCRQNDPNIQASLCLAKARKAIEEGNDPEAQSQFRAAVAQYEAMPESASTLNNAAISYNGLFALLGQAEDLRRAAELLDRAVGFQPDNSILLINTAETFQKLAIAEVVGAKVDLRLMGMQDDLDLVRLCYLEEAEHDRLVAELKQREAMTKALAYYDRAMLLAPKRASNYLKAATLYAFLEDAAALKRIDQRVREAAPDTAESVAETQRYLRGERDGELRTHLARRTAQARQLADHWRAQPAGEMRSRSLAGALNVLAEMILAAAATGEPADMDEAVRLAEQAQAEQASSATHRGLVAALVGRASRQAEATSPEFQALAETGRRRISQYDCVLLALARPSLADQFVQQADVLRAVELVRQGCERFPDTGSIEDALLLAPFDEKAAARQRELAGQDEMDRTSGQIFYRLHPANGQAGLSLIRQLELDGKSTEAAAVREELAGRGVILP